ncbi:MAG: YqgE/AlgH family protein, partial [Ilumatobacteraceae bacterium]
MDIGGIPLRSTKGSLLVAVPLLDDPNFHRSVIYMLQHTREGALGLILNKPTDEDELPGLDPWVDELSHPQVVFDGGPVEANTLIAVASLARSTADRDGDTHAAAGGAVAAAGGGEDGGDGDGDVDLGDGMLGDGMLGDVDLGDGMSGGYAPLDHGLGTVDLSQLPGEIAEELQNLRVFRGYSGWGPGQLEDEIDEGSWIALQCDTADLFTPN